MELGVERVARLGGEHSDQVVEIALPVDPAELEGRLRHRAHRSRRR